MNKILIILFALSLQSCSKVFMAVNGMHNPREIDSLEIVDVAIKYGFPVKDILIPKDSFAYQRIISLEAIPFPIIYNQGIHKSFRTDSARCNASAYSVVEDICNAPLIPNRNNTLEGITGDLLPLVEEVGQQQYDFTVFLTWGEFLGKWNRIKVKYFRDALAMTHGCTVKVYYINIDLHKWR